MQLWRDRSVLVVGDVGLDEYIMGQVSRISPEAPVPVLEVDEEDKRLGLAAYVAQNVASLGGKPFLVGVVGDDAGGRLLKGLFSEAHLSDENLVVDSSRPTTRKTRIMAKQGLVSKHHHVVRVDWETRKHLPQEVEKAILEKVRRAIPQCEAVVIEDYGKGVLSPKCITEIVSMAHARGLKVLLDPHRTISGEHYRGVDLLKPNFDEALSLSGVSFDEVRDKPENIMKIGHELRQKTGAKDIVMTQGREGMTVFSDNQVTHVPTYARQVFDVTGAGDTVLAALALGVAAGLKLDRSCILANFAAGVVVGKVGCVPCTVQELSQYIEDHGQEAGW
jgi:rfaE bifunctional protein kinase chain/domain